MITVEQLYESLRANGCEIGDWQIDSDGTVTTGAREIEALLRQQSRLREALVSARNDLECRDGDGHCCPACDCTTVNALDRIDALLSEVPQK